MEEFLQIESILNEDNIPSQASEPQRYSQKKDLLYQKLMMDTLAKFYMKEGKFVEAAKVLDSLALKLGLVEGCSICWSDSCIQVL